MQSYRRFLIGLGESLLDAVREAENLEWHHASASSEQFTHYNRMVGWLQLVGERLLAYDAHKARTAWRKLRALPDETSVHAVVRYQRELNSRLGDAGDDRPELGDRSG